MWVENYLYLIGRLVAGSGSRTSESYNEALGGAQTLVLITEELLKRSQNDI
jgi:hypothetical protein